MPRNLRKNWFVIKTAVITPNVLCCIMLHPYYKGQPVKSACYCSNQYRCLNCGCSNHHSAQLSEHSLVQHILLPGIITCWAHTATPIDLAWYLGDSSLSLLTLITNSLLVHNGHTRTIWRALNISPLDWCSCCPSSVAHTSVRYSVPNPACADSDHLPSRKTSFLTVCRG